MLCDCIIKNRIIKGDGRKGEEQREGEMKANFSRLSVK
jgi:hypothetical protein